MTTATETTTATVTELADNVTVDAAGLIRAITNLAPFACTDDTLPVLCGIHLRLADGKLRLEATDRYIAGWDELPVSGSLGSLDVIADAKSTVQAAKTITGILRPWKHLAEPPKVHVRHAAGTTFVSFEVTGYPGPDVPVPASTVEGDFPNIARLVPSGDGALVTRFASRNLAKLAKVSDGGKDPVVRLESFEGAAPARFGLEGDESFGGLIMTVRAADGKNTTRNPAGRWPQAGDTVRFEKAGSYQFTDEYRVTASDNDGVFFERNGIRYGLPRALASHLGVTVVKQDEQPQAEPDDQPSDLPEAGTWPEPQQARPGQAQLEAMLEAAAHDTQVSFATSCSQGCEVEADGRCGHGHPTWLRRYGLI